jgi:hypothetical protein
MITSDAGTLLLREIDRKYSILESFSQCFTDYWDSRYTDHIEEELVCQRVYAISAGYEDVKDHNRLRHDSLLAKICWKEDPERQGRELGGWGLGKGECEKSVYASCEWISR